MPQSACLYSALRVMIPNRGSSWYLFRVPMLLPVSWPRAHWMSLASPHPRPTDGCISRAGWPLFSPANESKLGLQAVLSPGEDMMCAASLLPRDAGIWLPPDQMPRLVLSKRSASGSPVCAGPFAFVVSHGSPRIQPFGEVNANGRSSRRPFDDGVGEPRQRLGRAWSFL